MARFIIYLVCLIILILIIGGGFYSLQNKQDTVKKDHIDKSQNMTERNNTQETAFEPPKLTSPLRNIKGYIKSLQNQRLILETRSRLNNTNTHDIFENKTFILTNTTNYYNQKIESNNISMPSPTGGTRIIKSAIPREKIKPGDFVTLIINSSNTNLTEIPVLELIVK